MKLYETKGFPNPLRVAIALAEKKASDKIEFVHVDVMGGEHRSPEFLAKNPAGAVPVLELEDGTTIAESTAVTEFIDHYFDGPSLTGKTAQQRSVTHMMQRRAETMVIDAVSAYFHHATEGLGPELEAYQNKDWGLKQREKALSGFEYFNTLLANREYVSGDEFSMADITLFAGLAFADFANIEIDSSLVNLIGWRQRIANRPSVIAAAA
jgi:glutathione S-transferase